MSGFKFFWRGGLLHSGSACNQADLSRFPERRFVAGLARPIHSSTGPLQRPASSAIAFRIPLYSPASTQ
jgi:hypothetical protein